MEQPAVTGREAPITGPTPSASSRRGRMMFAGAVLVVLLLVPALQPFVGFYSYMLQLGIVVLMWVAMTSSHSYQTPVGRDKAAVRLREGAGTQFDAALVERFLRGLTEIAP